MLQVGAAVTDWLLGCTCAACALRLYWVAPRPHEQWVTCVVVGLACEAVACATGGLSWALGTNRIAQDDLKLFEWAIVLVTVLGMAGQGLAIFAAGRAYDLASDGRAADRARTLAIWGFLGVLAYEGACLLLGADGTFILQPAGLPIVGWPSLLPACGSRGGRNAAKVAAGAGLIFLGGVVIVVYDNRCGGSSCITEIAPWDHRPCLAALSPDGSSCPFPDVFNHAAYMHVLCVGGVALATTGFCNDALRPAAAKIHKAA